VFAMDYTKIIWLRVNNKNVRKNGGAFCVDAV